MDNSQCKTPGAIFHTEFHSDTVIVQVDLPYHLELTEHEARELQDKLHDVMEGVLAPYWSLFGTTQTLPNGESVRVITATKETEANLREIAESVAWRTGSLFWVGQIVTLVDPYQVADVIEVSEDGSQAQIKYYDCRDGGDIKRWIRKDDVMEGHRPKGVNHARE